MYVYNVCVYVCMGVHVCVYICVCICAYVCMYVCMYVCSQTSLIRASLIRMHRNPNIIPGNLFYHFLFIMIQSSACFTIRTHFNGHQAVRINEVWLCDFIIPLTITDTADVYNVCAEKSSCKTHLMSWWRVSWRCEGLSWIVPTNPRVVSSSVV